MQNNSAGRLYKVIEQIKSNCWEKPDEVLGKAFNVNSKNKTDFLLDKYFDLYRLTKLAKEDILSIDGINHEKYLTPINDIVLALPTIKLNYPDGFQSFANTIDEKTMIRLEYSCEILSEKIGEETIDQETIELISSEIEELIKFVDDSDLDIELKALLINSLMNIKISILNYNLWGLKGIKKELESSAGTIILNGNLLTDEKEFSVFKIVFESIGKFNQIITFGKAVKELYEPLKKLFLGS